MREISEDFVIRNSTLKKNIITELYTSEDLNEFIKKNLKDDSINERLYVSNQQLLNTKSKSDKLDLTLAKYILRMGFRTTPFGLFSSYSMNNKVINEDKKSITLSIDWLEKLIEIVEKQTLNIKNYRLFLCMTYKKIDDHIYFYGFKDRKKIVFKFKYTNINMDLILKLENSIDINFDELSDIEKKIILLYLDNKIIRTELFTLSNEILTLRTLADIVEFTDPNLSSNLNKLYELITKYSYTKVGEGLSLYKQIIEIMEFIVLGDTRKYLNIYYLEKTPNYLSDIMKNINFNELMKALELKVLLEINTSQKVMDEIILDFTEKYGLYHDVQLTEYIKEIEIERLLTEHIYIEENRKNNLLDQLIRVHHNKEVINLNENDLKFIFGNNSEINLNNYGLNGFDFSVHTIIKENKPFQLSFYNGLISKSMKSSYAKISDLKNFNNNKYNMKESTLRLPVEIRTNENKDISHYFINESIAITDVAIKENNIPLSDLFIGIDEKGIYLKSKLLNKKIVPYFLDLYNILFFNEKPISKFLYLYSDYVNKNFSLNTYTENNFTPRIMYNNIILMEKTWRIFKFEYKYLNIKMDFENFKYFIDEKCIQFHLPEYLLINQYSNMLPLKKGTILFYKILYEHFNNPKVNYLELVDGSEYLCNGKIKNHELVFSVLPTDNYQKLASFEVEEIKFINKKVDFNTSYYSILYNYFSYEEIVLPILDLLYKYKAQGVFFINYKKNHVPELRVRFKTDALITSYLEEKLNDMLTQQQLIISYSKELHFPEYSRYFGENGYPTVRRYFEYDTNRFYITNTESKTLYGDEKIFNLVKMSLRIFVNLCNDYEEFTAYLSTFYSKNHKNYLFYKKNRDLFKAISHEIFNEQFNRNLKNDEKIYLDPIKKLIDESNNKDKNSYLIKSIHHMMFNRNFGINRLVEDQVFEISYYCFKNLKRQFENNR
ncbi:thiopeptide-type bacteriocin biosynthesis protein [Viridibacillus arvi]|uniref:Lantibiotic dehydratase N-terminal domain-containing protein n=1 Tax=Viridibacillus arvi TaxID=263475 RepID=A0A0M0LLG7_9BACL|nr:thiopeptide-type bacteriocin biosynthesis protein [Viridibacillus arvi]KOO51841.1 hypothetical protein AMD00_05240 [Viridibacillus arvi]